MKNRWDTVIEKKYGRTKLEQLAVSSLPLIHSNKTNKPQSCVQ